MKAHSHIITIAVALLISVPSYAAEVASNIETDGLVSSEEFDTGNSEESDSTEESESDSTEESENDSSGESENDSSGESGNDSNLANFNEPISDSDIGGSVDISESEPDIVNEPIHFDDSVNFNNNDDDEQLLATPIPAAIWLFITGLLGFSSLEKRKKKI